MKRPLVILVLVAVALGALLYFWPRTAVPPTLPEPAAPIEIEPIIRYPVEDVPAISEIPAAEPLPALDESDAAFADALVAAAPAGLDTWLAPVELIRHIVVTVDNLVRETAAVELRPLKPVPGQFEVNDDGEQMTLSSKNFARYTPLLVIVQATDVDGLAAVYLRYYPLFQQAYEELGYPDGYFNDRLVEVIDRLLATPDATGPIVLVRPKVMYRFADPDLEALPAGSKLLLRMGPEHAAVIKARLREFRRAIVGQAAVTAP
jgi:hypothetical protein